MSITNLKIENINHIILITRTMKNQIRKKLLSSNSNFKIQNSNFSFFNLAILTIMHLCIIVSGYSQQLNPQTLLPSVFPVNPKAFELLKYTEIPVSKYTGIPSISVPIYTINAKGLAIPIGLNYHSNGFRISEEAGWTGLGWTLDAGGCIVQVVKGFDDFGYFKNRDIEAQTMVDAMGARNNMPNSILSTCTTVNFRVQYPITSSLDFNPNSALITGIKDMEPDVFKFNMPGGYSGEFILDWKNETYYCISDKNIKIEKTADGFHIITPDGNRYYFELKEETVISGINRISQLPNSQTLESLNMIGEKSSRVYQLTRIITIGGDIITYNYAQTTGLIENIPAISTLNESYTFERTGYCPNLSPKTQISDIFKQNKSTTVNYSRQSLSYLSSIDFPEGTLEFNCTNDRIDCIGTQKLDSIFIKDKNNFTVKSFVFAYDYFIGHSLGANNDNYLDGQSPVYHTGKVSSELTHRLKLLSVKESDKPAWLFEYDPEPLPKKTSLAFDPWGYYAGSQSSGAYLKNNKASVLTKITYPTGGTTTFDYELNVFNNYIVPDDVHSVSTSISLHDRNNFDDHVAEIFMADLPSMICNGDLNINTYGPLSLTTGALSAYIRLTILKKTTANLNLVNTPTTFWPIYYTTPLAQLGTKINDVIEDSRILNFEFIQANQAYETFKLLQNYSIPIDPGFIYIIQAYLDPSFGPQTNGTQGANAQANFTFIKNYYQDISYGAGLRVKNIITESPTSPTMIKSYKYTGGKLMSPLIYSMKSNIDYDILEVIDRDPVSGMPIYGFESYTVTKTSINSSSFYSISTNASGKYVGYDEVEESNSIDRDGTIVQNANGKIVDTYTNTPDVDIMDLTPTNGITPLGFLYPARKAPLQNGLVSMSKVFDKNQTVLEEITNRWDYKTSPFCTYGRIQARISHNTDHVCGVYSQIFTGNDSYFVAFYPINSTKTLSFGFTKINHTYSGDITNSQSNEYDSHDQILKKTQTNSKNETISTYYKYPYDFNNYFFTMNWDNYLTPVIEQRIELNSKLLSTVKDDYEPMGGDTNPRAYIKRKTSSSTGTGPLEDEIVFDLYSSPENAERYKLLQYHTRNGIPISIVWGYQGQYTIAKIEGIGYNSISANAIAEIKKLETAGNNLAVINNNIRSLLPNCFVTTYTYKPLVGMTSSTDPNGLTTYYDYDTFGRLNLVKDKDTNILKTYDYHYKK